MAAASSAGGIVGGGLYYQLFTTREVNGLRIDIPLLVLTHYKRFFNTDGIERIPDWNASIPENIERLVRLFEYIGRLDGMRLFKDIELPTTVTPMLSPTLPPLILFSLYHSGLIPIDPIMASYERKRVPENTTVIQYAETFSESDLTKITHLLLNSITSSDNLKAFYTFLTNPSRENYKENILGKGLIDEMDKKGYC